MRQKLRAIAPDIADAILDNSYDAFHLKDILLFGGALAGKPWEGHRDVQKTRKPDLDMLIIHDQDENLLTGCSDLGDYNLLEEFRGKNPYAAVQKTQSDMPPDDVNRRKHSSIILSALGNKWFPENYETRKDPDYFRHVMLQAFLLSIPPQDISMYFQEKLQDKDGSCAGIEEVFSRFSLVPQPDPRYRQCLEEKYSEALANREAYEDPMFRNITDMKIAVAATMHALAELGIYPISSPRDEYELQKNIRETLFKVDGIIQKKIKNEFNVKKIVENIMSDLGDLDDILDLHVMPVGLLKESSDPMIRYSRDEYIKSCLSQRFWHQVLSSGRLYDRQKRDFCIPIKDKYPSAPELFLPIVDI